MEPHEEFNEFEKEMKDTQEFMRKAIMESLEKNCNDWGKASAWAAHSLGNLTEGAESPESDVPPVEELMLLEIGKLQWINMQILNELRKNNK